MFSFSELGMLGRLGNQMFQLVSCLGIAKANNTNATFPKWKYEEYFENELPHAINSNTITLKEKHYHFDESLFHLNQNKNYNLSGFFQSEKYWKHAEKEVRQQFTFKTELKERLKKQFSAAFEKPLVAISIRRGDFVKNKYYYQVPISYYLSAYYKHFNDYNILIFTDDFAYCKLHFESLPNVYYADKLNDIEQLCLMSMCDNFIISNSTFSWWGAYLSGSKNVIRPIKNVSDEYAKTTDEKDFWQPYFKIHNEKIDLTDTTFVIPVYYDHLDRKLNIMLTVGFLLKNFNTNIIIGEQGGNEFKFMSEYVQYTTFDMEHFHRTKMINELIKGAKTDVVVNWDGDNICTPAQLIESVRSIRNGADIAYPFDGRVVRVPRYMFNDIIESLDVVDIDISKCMPKAFTSVGHAVVMNKQSFITAGMENENFISWSCEDSCRWNRYRTLGLDVQRIKGKIYHMDHFIGINSCTQNPFFLQGEKEFHKVKSMKKTELKKYISTWEWCKNVE